MPSRSANVRGEAYELEVTHVDWDLTWPRRGGYPDFMLKEIHEQPRVIRDTLAGRLVNGALSIDELDLTLEELNLIDRVYVIACGTSYHAGLIAKNLIEGCRIPTEVEGAMNRYRKLHHHRPPWWWPCRSRARRPTRWPPSATRA